MATIKEDYVSFETAKLLKEKEFNEECFALYNPDDTLIQSGIRLNNTQVGRVKGSYSAPTLQMAMKWLREVHTIDIVITPSMFRRKYNVCIYKEEKLCCIDFDGDTLSPSYEQACESAIKYCIKHLI